jgi:5'-methylthioinosine phosphorylase
MLAIIGGTGYRFFAELKVAERHLLSTEYGDPSAAILQGELNGHEVLFLSRHGGNEAPIPPHRVNYCANLAALKQLGAKQILALNAVGGMRAHLGPRVLAVPHDLIDYTQGRRPSIWDGPGTLRHVDFSQPYSPGLRASLLAAADRANVPVVRQAVYAVTQGPRLETPAEIRKLQADGCDIVGMTAMPEAAIARELALEYASLCLVANFAAGVADEEITMDEVHANLKAGGDQVSAIVLALLAGGK